MHISGIGGGPATAIRHKPRHAAQVPAPQQPLSQGLLTHPQGLAPLSIRVCAQASGSPPSPPSQPTPPSSPEQEKPPRPAPLKRGGRPNSSSRARPPGSSSGQRPRGPGQAGARQPQAPTATQPAASQPDALQQQPLPAAAQPARPAAPAPLPAGGRPGRQGPPVGGSVAGGAAAQFSSSSRQPQAPPKRWADDEEEDEEDYGDDDDDDGEDSVLEQEGDELVIDPEEADRLVFGAADFSRGREEDREGEQGAADGRAGGRAGARARLSPAEQQQAALDACRAALIAAATRTSPAPLPLQLTVLALATADQGLAPTDPDALITALSRVMEVAGEVAARDAAAAVGGSGVAAGGAGAAARGSVVSGGGAGAAAGGRGGPAGGAGAAGVADAAASGVVVGGAGVLDVLLALRGSLGEHGQEIDLEQVMGAALRVPGVLRLRDTDIRERMQGLIPLLNLKPGRMPAACCEHPEVLVAPLEEVRKKLTVMRNVTGLTGESALAMLTPYMFGGM